MRQLTPFQLSQQIRTGQFQCQTNGLVQGDLQCNMTIVSQSLAAGFLLFCLRNPKACLSTALTESGQFLVLELGQNIDLRTDLVGFLIDCSFSFQETLIAAEMEIRHISEGKNIPMYNTNLPCVSAGRFSGNIVVSMRPMRAADVIWAIQICSRFPAVQGAPLYFSDPAAIGISDIRSPDYGDAVPPAAVIKQANPDFCMTHGLGYVLVTDALNSSLASF